MYVPDNYDMFEQHERKIADAEAHWPTCPICDEMLEDEAYRIDDQLICWDCATDWLSDQKETVYAIDEEEEW